MSVIFKVKHYPSSPFLSLLLLLLLHMKFSSSSLDLNSSDAATDGCISSFIRRLLCGGLSGRACQEGHVVAKKQAVLSPAPGLVPGLMGLDTWPELPTVAAPNSVCRSRSMGSLESQPTFATEQRYHGPRIRPSSSFREVPTFLRKENEEFLVLSFGPDDGEEIETREGLMGLEEEEEEEEREEINGENPNRRKRVPEKRNKRNHQLRRNSVLEINGAPGLLKKDDAQSQRKLLLRPENQKQMLPERTKLGKKNMGYYSDTKAESECSSQDSSPVSVLDSRLEFDKASLINPSTPISEEHLKPVQRNSRRKLSSDLDNLNPLSPGVHLVSVSDRGGLKPTEEEIKENDNCRLLKCSEAFGKISKLVEEDVKKRNWILRELWKVEEFEEITVGFELQILDLLLQEAVTELSSLLSAL